jgi:uncharacterized membrane protein
MRSIEDRYRDRSRKSGKWWAVVIATVFVVAGFCSLDARLATVLLYGVIIALFGIVLILILAIFMRASIMIISGILGIDDRYR